MAGRTTHTALTGQVVATFRRHYTVELDNSESDSGGPVNERLNCLAKGRHTTLACGDRVEVKRIAGGGAITAVQPRRNLFYRSDAFREKLIAANLTQVVGVTAPDLALDEMLLNRWLIAARAEDCRFILVANKSDLPGFDELRARLAPYSALDCTIVELCARRNAEILLPWLDGQHSVLIGQSGMGKSTLINALIPQAASATSDISEALDSGRHTTTSTTLYPLPAPRDGWVIDSPGMKMFGLAHLSPEALLAAFTDIAPFAAHCRFRDCRHQQEPDCAVQQAVCEHRIHPKRLELFHTLMAERAAAEQHR